MPPKWVQIYKDEIKQSLLPMPNELINIIHSYFSNWQSQFAPFQQIAYDYCMQGFHTFITGPAGAGKTYLLSSIVEQLSRNGQTVIVTASTGKAAVMIKGQTFHSFTKLMKIKQQGRYPDLSNEYEWQYWSDIWRGIYVFVVDEISMITPNDFQLLIRMWKDLHVNIQLIVLGDFFQLPPVITEASEFRYCFETPEWKQTIQKTAYLHDVFRQSDQAFVRTLNAIRIGRFTAFDIERIQRRWIHHPSYKNIRSVLEYKNEYTWMFATNKEANDHNQNILQTIKGETHVYRSMFGYAQHPTLRGRALTKPPLQYFTQEDIPKSKEYLFTDPKFRDSFGVEHVIHLKIGVRVLLTVNINVMQGLVNGACGTIVDFSIPDRIPNYKNIPLPVVKFDNGIVTHIVIHEWQMTIDRNTRNEIHSFIWLAQLPLRYAYAMTAHKAQGMTMKQGVVVSLRHVFVKTQPYIFFSRVEQLENLHLLDPIEANMVQADPIVQRFYETIM